MMRRQFPVLRVRPRRRAKPRSHWLEDFSIGLGAGFMLAYLAFGGC